ncbi:HAD-IA family hydrolase [Paraglaciecola sp. L3A3]|uniref:HAD-IA family hydrolase n=1 Tax=Paraglaciecola sp. L3A3 TaxID=2686358 RepID=UPI00131AD0C5|nr:HAD-IA family hydrolase [Paraglaciecola sp. L3A3]
MIFYKKLNPIQAITFDLDDTLYENGSVIKNATASLRAFQHKEFSITKSLDTQYWRKIEKELLIDHPILHNDIGQLRFRSLQLGFQQLGYNEEQAVDAARRCFQHFYDQRSNFSVDANIHWILKTLAEKIPLVAITNGNVDVEKIGIADYLSACFKSSVTVPMKPNIAMFDAAQDMLAIPAKNILHVGDNLEKDVFGAIRAGYQAAWYAEDREMSLNSEQTLTLPHVQLQSLNQLLELVF